MAASGDTKSGMAAGAAAERLTILWIVCTVMLLIMIVMLTLIGREKLRGQSDVITRQTQEIESLHSRVDELEQSVLSLRQRSQTRDLPTPSSSGDGRPPPKTMPRAAATGLTESDVLDRLARCFSPHADSESFRLIDVRTATAIVMEVVNADEQADWTGETWGQLAQYAQVIAPMSAAVFADRARAAGVIPVKYDELRVRELLSADQPTDALPLAEELAGTEDAPPAAPILLAAARIAAGQGAAARIGLTTLPRLDRISSEDRLLLADVLLRLDRWAELRTVLADWRAPTPAARLTVNRYRAVESIQREQFATGLAILDELLQSAPDDYELRLWRAICLAKAGQRDAAREALAHKSLNVDRPEVWYWRGMVELASGDAQAAEQAYQRAVATDRRYAPAWEALGSLSLNADRADEAIRLLNVAVEIGPERPSTHFLLAIAHARAADRPATLVSLGTALTLDPGLLETALATEMIVGLVGETELRRIAEARPANTE